MDSAPHEGHDQDRCHETECPGCGEVVRCPEEHTCIRLSKEHP